jgi:hypothetical protein
MAGSNPTLSAGQGCSRRIHGEEVGGKYILFYLDLTHFF